MTRHQKRRFWFFALVGLALTGYFGYYWFNPQHIPDNFTGINNVFDLVLFILVTYIIWHQILAEVFAWAIAYSMKRPRYMKPQQGLKVAFISTFVPGKEPHDMLERNLQGMSAAEYPHDTWVLDEGDDPAAKELCEKYGAKHFSRFGLEKYNQANGTFKAKTKGGNHNAWYDSHGKNYDIVAQIDLDFVPDKKFLTKTLGYFRDPSVAFVGTPQVYGNSDESLVAQGAAEQSFNFYGTIEKGLFGQDMTMMVGANHIIRVSALKEIGWYAGHITEDLLTGMHIYTKKWKSVYVPEVLAVGEGPATWESYFNQQMRWAYGCIHILFNHSFDLFKSMHRKHRVMYYIMQQHYFSGLTLVLGVGLLTIYFLSGISSADMELWPMIAAYLPLIIWQIIFTTWLQKFSIRPGVESGFLWRGRMVAIAAAPIYFLALLGVLRGEKLTFKVTPKGEGEIEATPISLFLPHFILGTFSFAGLIVGMLNGNTSPVLLFWAAANTLLMYGLVSMVVAENLKAWHFNRSFQLGNDDNIPA
jgi:cellulose synthase/poly-beta-1,6-N-acetylglucosamine synthase-like glycosyltransferase